MELTKLCPKCKEIKPYSAFVKDARTRTGRKSYCRICQNELGRQWRLRKLKENPNYYRDKYRENPEAAKARVKKYREKHKERLNRERMEYYYTPEGKRKSQIAHRKWYKKTREQYREKIFLYGRTAMHRGEIRPFGGFLRTQGICLFCGEGNPLVLQNAHVFEHNHDLLLSLCANCHLLLDRYPMSLDL